MKPIDFIKEDFVTDAADAHQDHEVQMARADCYTAAKYAIELHKLLKHISEQQGLDGWVSEKLTLANDYLRTVHEYLTYEQHSQAMPGFDPQVAEMQIESVVNEGDSDKLHIPDSDKMSDTERHQAIMAKHPDAARVGKTPGRYKTKDGDLVSGIRGVRKLTKESGYQHGFADPNAPKLGGGRQNDEPDAVNNIEISIDGRAWKVFAGRGPDSSQAFFKQKQSVDDLCKRKSRETGKEWTWGVTGKPASVDESAGGMGAGSVASSMGGGNGFLNGGPGTISRTKAKKAKK